MIFHAPTRTIIYAPGVELPAGVRCEIRKGHSLVRATYGNLLSLAYAGLPIPSPMLNYDWPCRPGETALDTQRLVAAHMVLYPRSYVVSDMRTGKTRAALWACDWLMARARTQLRAVIVSDIEALTKTWASEITTSFLGRRTYSLLRGTARQRERALAEDADFYLVNHDGLRVGYSRQPDRCTGLAAAILRRNDLQIAVFDEAATYRNRTTHCFGAARQLLSQRAAYAWALTGAPNPNGPLDAYGIKKLIDLSYRENFESWKNRTTIPRGPFRREPVPHAADLVSELLSPAVRITRAQCFIESPLEITTVRAELSEKQRYFMTKLKDQLLVFLDGGAQIPAVNQAALRAKLIQIACGAVYGENHEAHEIDAGPRLQTFTDLVRQTKGKIIVFSPLTSVVHMLHRHLRNDSLKIASDLPAKVRRGVVADFIQKDKKVLISHPAPIARGVDLTIADTIVWYAPTDRTEYYLQANQRINGPAQKNVRRIIRLSGSPVEDEIYEKLERNETLQGAILKLKEMKL